MSESQQTRGLGLIDASRDRDDALRRALIEKARTDFLTYVRICNPPSSGFVLSGLHKYLIAMVQEVSDTIREGRSQEQVEGLMRKITSVPPQHGKSKILSVESPAWIMGVHPGINIAVTGYSQDLTIGFAKQVRSRMTTPIHRAIFNDAIPLDGENRADAFTLANGSNMRAKSTGAKLTGRRVDWLIVDDPHSGREEAESPTQRKRVHEWYNADCYTRLSPNPATASMPTRCTLCHD